MRPKIEESAKMLKKNKEKMGEKENDEKKLTQTLDPEKNYISQLMKRRKGKLNFFCFIFFFGKNISVNLYIFYGIFSV